MLRSVDSSATLRFNVGLVLGVMMNDNDESESVHTHEHDEEKEEDDSTHTKNNDNKKMMMSEEEAENEKVRVARERRHTMRNAKHNKNNKNNNNMFITDNDDNITIINPLNNNNNNDNNNNDEMAVATQRAHTAFLNDDDDNTKSHTHTNIAISTRECRVMSTRSHTKLHALLLRDAHDDAECEEELCVEKMIKNRHTNNNSNNNNNNNNNTTSSLSWSSYTYSVCNDDDVDSDNDEHTHSSSWCSMSALSSYKLRYVCSELTHDLQLSHTRTSSYIIMCIIMLLCMWVRVYIHYIAQYVYLRSIHVHVTQFTLTLYTCVLTYTHAYDTHALHTQLGMIVVGQLSLILMYILLITLVYVAHIRVCSVWIARVCVCMGVCVMCDALLILIVDIATHNYTHGDAFKLYHIYAYVSDDASVMGVLFTLVLMCMMYALSLYILYIYVIYIHMHGRILDTHHRLHAHDAYVNAYDDNDRAHTQHTHTHTRTHTHVQLPHDMELSLRALRYICAHSKTWAGMNGACRITHIYKYHHTHTHDTVRTEIDDDDNTHHHDDDDDNDEFACEKSVIHIAIFTQQLNGEVELYRHFLRNVDGSIYELFDTLSSSSSSYTNSDSALRMLEEKLKFKQTLTKRQQQRALMNTNVMKNNNSNAFRGERMIVNAADSESEDEEDSDIRVMNSNHANKSSRKMQRPLSGGSTRKSSINLKSPTPAGKKSYDDFGL